VHIFYLFGSNTYHCTSTIYLGHIRLNVVLLQFILRKIVDVLHYFKLCYHVKCCTSVSIELDFKHLLKKKCSLSDINTLLL